MESFALFLKPLNSYQTTTECRFTSERIPLCAGMWQLEINKQCHPLLLSTSLLESSLSVNLEHPASTRLPGQRASGTYTYAHACAGAPEACYHTWRFIGFWGVELQPQRLHNKHFTCWAISPDTWICIVRMYSQPHWLSDPWYLQCLD